MSRSSYWRRSLGMLLTMVMVASLAACGKAQAPAAPTTPASPAGPVKIQFWHALPGAQGDVLKSLVGEFNATQKEVVVEPVFQGNYSDLNNKLLAALASGKPPAMSMMYENETSKYLESQALVPVQKFIDDPKAGMKPDEVNDILEVFRKNNTWNGQMVTMPFNKSAYVLFYNTDLIKEPPKTWDELEAIAKKVTRKNGDKVEVYGFGLRPNVDTFNTYLVEAGSDFLSPDEKKATFAGPEGVQALEFIVRLVKEQAAMNIASGYESDVFGPGKIAMYIGSSAGFAFVAKNSQGKHGWNVAPLPAGPKTNLTISQGTNVGIFAKASPEEQLAAWRFIKWLVSPEITAKYASKTGYVPVRASAAGTQVWKDHVAKDAKNGVPFASLKNATFGPRTAKWAALRNVISSAIEKAVAGSATPKDALAGAAAKVDQELAK